jgi:hypothetical protein
LGEKSHGEREKRIEETNAKAGSISGRRDMGRVRTGAAAVAATRDESARESAGETWAVSRESVALSFSLTTCSHCQDPTRLLNKLAPVYITRGVQFLECAYNGDAQATMREFLDHFQPPFPVGWITDSGVRSYLGTIADPRPLYAPHTVFLDRRGTIRAEGEGDFFRKSEENIRAELERLLKR